MRLALSVLLRLLAPYLSFVCEEVWSWWQPGSVHRTAWPARAELTALAGEDAAAQQAVLHLTEALNAIRKAKTDQKLSVGTPVKDVIYSASAEAVKGLALVERDLKAACRADSLMLTAAAEAGVQITPKPAEA